MKFITRSTGDVHLQFDDSHKRIVAGHVGTSAISDISAYLADHPVSFAKNPKIELSGGFDNESVETLLKHLICGGKENRSVRGNNTITEYTSSDNVKFITGSTGDVHLQFDDSHERIVAGHVTVSAISDITAYLVDHPVSFAEDPKIYLGGGFDNESVETLLKLLICGDRM